MDTLDFISLGSLACFLHTWWCCWLPWKHNTSWVKTSFFQTEAHCWAWTQLHNPDSHIQENLEWIPLESLCPTVVMRSPWGHAADWNLYLKHYNSFRQNIKKWKLCEKTASISNLFPPWPFSSFRPPLQWAFSRWFPPEWAWFCSKRLKRWFSYFSLFFPFVKCLVTIFLVRNFSSSTKANHVSVKEITVIGFEEVRQREKCKHRSLMRKPFGSS